MTNYHYRKYEGPPIQELKQESTEPAPKSFHGITDYKGGKADEEITNLWRIKPKTDGKRWWFRDDPVFYVHVGMIRRWGYHSAPDHVIRRLKAHLIRNKDMGIFWLQAEATKQQISPEFHTYSCLVDWLMYEGLSRGWLYVESGTHEWWDRKKQKKIVRRWTRLATT
jgi:hypothetical protein